MSIFHKKKLLFCYLMPDIALVNPGKIPIPILTDYSAKERIKERGHNSVLSGVIINHNMMLAVKTHTI